MIKLLLSILLILNIGVNMPTKKSITPVPYFQDGNKGGKSRLPADIQFCYPNYRELQKKSFREIMKIVENRKTKVNPFFYKPPVRKEEHT